MNFYKSVTGNFNLNYIPCWQYADIESSLNKRRYEGFPQHKCNLHYFVPEKHRPKTLIYCIDGVIYNNDNQTVNIDEAVDILAKESSFVFKIASGTGGGKGVRKIDVKSQQTIETLKETLLREKNDYICQEILKQDKFIESLSGGCVNTIRMLTLNLNGKASLLSAFLKMGPTDSFTDNVCGGGIGCGIDSDGNLCEFGVFQSFEKTATTPSGKTLKGLQIKNFDKIVETVLSLSNNFQQMHLIGWDIAIKEDGTPIVIEVNLDCGQVPVHQIFNGPVFGSRTEEVLEYMKNHKPHYLLKIPL